MSKLSALEKIYFLTQQRNDIIVGNIHSMYPARITTHTGSPSIALLMNLKNYKFKSLADRCFSITIDDQDFIVSIHNQATPSMQGYWSISNAITELRDREALGLVNIQLNARRSGKSVAMKQLVAMTRMNANHAQ